MQKLLSFLESTYAATVFAEANDVRSALLCLKTRSAAKRA